MGTPSCIVYLATNRATGARYVGFTSRSLARRAYEHEWEASRSKRTAHYILHRAIYDYGAAAFDWTILASGLTRADALALEMLLIAELKPEYNATAGGQGGNGLKRSAETRAKQSASMKGRKASPETRAKFSAIRSGKPRSAETRKNIGAAKRGKPLSPEHRAALSASPAT